MTFKNYLEGYKLYFTPKAQKALDGLHKNLAKRIEEKLRELICGNQNLDIKKLQACENRYRLRVGDMRIIYEIHKHIITVYIIEIGPRRDIYD